MRLNAFLSCFLCVPRESTHSCCCDLITSGNNWWFFSNAQELQDPHECPSISHQPFQHLYNTHLIQIPVVKVPHPLCFIRKVCCYSYFSRSLEIKVLATANVRHISWGEKVMFLHGYPYCALIRTIDHQATLKHGGFLQFKFHWDFANDNPIRQTIVKMSRCWILTLAWHPLFVDLSHFPWPQHANLGTLNMPEPKYGTNKNKTQSDSTNDHNDIHNSSMLPT